MVNTLRLDKGQVEVLDDIMADILRHKTPAERISIGFGLWVAARDMLALHLHQIHPQWTEEQLRHEIVRRLSHGAI